MNHKNLRDSLDAFREDIVHGVFFAAASVFVAGVVLAMLL
jgi:hypothetical protein